MLNIKIIHIIINHNKIDKYIIMENLETSHSEPENTTTVSINNSDSKINI